MLEDLDQTLKQLLRERGRLRAEEVDVRFEMPNREWAGKLAKPSINLYLFDLRENRDLRLNEWAWQSAPPDRGLRGRPPVRVDVTYLVTAWTAHIEDEHRLLSRVLVTTLQHSELPQELLQGALRAQSMPIRLQVAQADGVLESPADFWAAMDNQLKGGVTLTATLTLDTEALETAPLVLTKQVRLRASAGRARRRRPVGAPATTETEHQPTSDDLDQWAQIAGTVYGQGEPAAPLGGATVVLVEKGLATETDERGRFTFPRLSQGEYTLSVRVAGEERWRGAVSVPSPSYDLRLDGRREDGGERRRRRD